MVDLKNSNFILIYPSHEILVWDLFLLSLCFTEILSTYINPDVAQD